MAQKSKISLAADTSFRSNYARLHSAIALPIVTSELASQLYERGIITVQTKDAVQLTTGITPFDRAASLLKAVETSIETDHQRLKEFICILKLHLTLKPTALRLHHCYRTLISEAGQLENCSSESDSDLKDSEQDAEVKETDAITSVPQQVKEFEDRFKGLTYDAQDEIREKHTPVRIFRHTVVLLPLSIRADHHQFLEKNLLNITKAESIDDIFMYLNLYWSFIDYNLLEHIIREHGSDYLKAKMDEYVEDIVRFKSTTTISQICGLAKKWISRPDLPQHFALLKTKLKKGPSEYTLEELECFRISFCREFSLSESAAMFAGVIEGSLVILWHLPSSLVSDLTSAILSHPHSNTFFEQQSLLLLELDGKCLYHSPTNTVHSKKKSIKGSPTRKEEKQSPPMKTDVILSRPLTTFDASVPHPVLQIPQSGLQKTSPDKEQNICHIPVGTIRMLTECFKCTKPYQRSNMPRILQCGHTYCTSCLKRLLAEECNCCLVCEEKCLIAEDVEQFAVNFFALDTLRELRPFLDEMGSPTRKEEKQSPPMKTDVILSRPLTTFDASVPHPVLQIPQSGLQKTSPDKQQVYIPGIVLQQKESVPADLYETFDDVLNNLTAKNFQLKSERAKRALCVEAVTVEHVGDVVDKITQKVFDSSSSAIYARLCGVLSSVKVVTGSFSKPVTVTFRQVLLRRCQNEFEVGINDSDKRREDLKMKHKKLQVTSLRFLRTIYFIGELFEVKLLSPKLMQEIVCKLLERPLQEDLLQYCANILLVVGQQLENEIEMDTCYGRIQQIIKLGHTSTRICAMLKDVLRRRERNWTHSLTRPDDDSQLTIKTTAISHKFGEAAPKGEVYPEVGRQQPIIQTMPTSTAPITLQYPDMRTQSYHHQRKGAEATPLPSNDELLMPWEHQVCHDCFKENCYAIWLIKQYCFQQQRHLKTESILVAIDPNILAMTQIRPLPRNSSFGHKFKVCTFKSVGCKRGLSCQSAHSSVEVDSWNIKKRIKTENPGLVDVAINARVCTQSPSVVCQICLTNCAKAVWLAWLRCLQPEKHNQAQKVRVVINSSHTNLVIVRLPPAHVEYLKDLKNCRGNCEAQDTCGFAHSEEELQFWKWKFVNNHYTHLGFEFEELWRMYSYPDETSTETEVEAMRQLDKENYKTKYHKLVYLDELAHSRKMIIECNGRVAFEVASMIDVHLPLPSISLTGMISAAIEYAVRGHAQVELNIDGHSYFASEPRRHEESDILLVSIQSQHFFQKFRGTIRNVPAHFEINHKYFKKLHQAIDHVDCVILDKLLPGSEVFTHRREQYKSNKTMAKQFHLDEEYQTKALKQIINCSSCAPYLMIGPFGTGKTHVLAATLATLLKHPRNRILLCTHQHICADSICVNLQKNSGGTDFLRLFPNEQAQNYSKIGSHIACMIMKNANAKNLNQWPAIITTFGTALNLKHLPGAAQLRAFSHILIDEGAQTREPEVLECLVLAKPDTKIVIAGDHQQVGPRVVVLSDAARNNGLGTSLIERLYKLYDKIGGTKTHVGALLTNYRSHPSILMLASSLLYEGTLLNRSNSKAHPKAPYPILFACTSLNQNQFANLPAENEKEAELIVNKMLEYVREWPGDAGVEKPRIGLLAPTKQQVALLRKKFNKAVQRPSTLSCHIKITPTYLIQGEEFSGVFLSTCEPTDAQGMPRDPVTSISDQYVFNTIITRSRSLVFAAGNPFFLNHLSKFWGEYIYRCLQCQTLLFSDAVLETTSCQPMKTILNKLSPYKMLDEATQLCFREEDADDIVKHYLSKLHLRKEYKIVKRLVQDPQGKMSWVEKDGTPKDSVVWCQIEFQNFDIITATPTDSTITPIILKGSRSRRGVLQSDVVKVDTVKQCVLLDDETEKALASAHFGKSFICKVDPNNPIRFIPLDKRDPKFVNLPTITKNENHGVVCFDPMSIKTIPKINDFIPIECALKMLFVVKFLVWRKKYPYPLGIIIGAIPKGNSLMTGDMILRINHGIPLTHETVFSDCTSPIPNEIPLMSLDLDDIDVFTIGSTLHCDNAFTCCFLSRRNGTSEYQIGVHISDIHRYAPKGRPVDVAAAEQGYAVYHNPDNCVSKLLPDSIINATRFIKNKPTYAYSVFAKVRVNGAVQSFHDIVIKESILKSNLELTYVKVQTIIDQVTGMNIHDSKHDEFSCHDHSVSLAAGVGEKLQMLWRFALFLRSQRLGRSFCYFPISEPTMEECVESHLLVEELMIWTNHQIARKLLKTFPGSTIIRTKKYPKEVQIKSLIQEYQSVMSASLFLSRYLPQEPVHELSSIQILTDVFQSKVNEFQKGNVKQGRHLIQFEHLHPQLAVVHSLFEHSQFPSMYQVSTKQQETYYHDTVKYDCYTHFTAPSKRYVDIVIQRQLHAVLNGERNPYTIDELKSICLDSMKAEKCSNDYKREFGKLHLACELQQSSKEFLCFVTKVKESKLFFCFQDLSLKGTYPSESSIHLRDLNASKISQATDNPLQLIPLVKLKRTNPNNNFASWRVKICSMSGSPQSFLANSRLQLYSRPQSDALGTGKVTLYIPKGGHLIEEKLSVQFQPYTYSIPFQTWKKAQTYLQQESETMNKKMLALLQKVAATENFPMGDSKFNSTQSPIWIYEVQKTLQPFEVFQVQLSVTNQETVLTPTVQLLEVAPGLQVCIQHNTYSVKCFVDKLTESASAKEYKDTDEYFAKWEKVVLAEAACCSLSDANLLLVKDVIAIWPKLVQRVDSAGQFFYQLPQVDGINSGVQIEFPMAFLEHSHEFFKFSVGDLICMRYNIKDAMQCVFHMVVHYTDRFFLNTDDEVRIPQIGNPSIYLKFACDTSNYISSKMEEFLKHSSKFLCELQLIPLALPYRRIYNSLYNLKSFGTRTKLSEQIACGTARTKADPAPRIEDILAKEEASITTALWPVPIQADYREIAELNIFQQEAIAVACSNTFSMIQGPPGTGKTVTGAHLAYALVMKFRKRVLGKSSRPRPCVMYCGPSQQSVDVVLDMLGSPVERNFLKVVRIYSNDIERKDFPGPKRNSSVFEPVRTETTCDPKRRRYALHHIVHQRDAIRDMDKSFEQYHIQEKIASQEERTQYQTLIKDAEVDVLRDSVDIVLCTCNEASSSRIRKSLRPFYCIIDECAMASEPECMIPIWQAENVVLIGDHMQLQPVIRYKRAGEMGLYESLYERYVERVGVHPYMLKTQYRMHPALCEFPSREFYNGELMTDRSVASKRAKEAAVLSHFWPQPGIPFVFCDTIGEEAEIHTREIERTRVGLQSKYNETEAHKIVQIARVLTDSYKVSPNDIVALTPYSAQSVVIEKHLEKENIHGITVKTITESQGSEYGIVLLSTVRSKPLDELQTPDGKQKKADIGWRNANIGFVRDRHRICVGITRCKYGMVIVGNRTLLSYNSTWNRLIEYYEKCGCIRLECEFPQSQLT